MWLVTTSTKLISSVWLLCWSYVTASQSPYTVTNLHVSMCSSADDTWLFSRQRWHVYMWVRKSEGGGFGLVGRARVSVFCGLMCAFLIKRETCLFVWASAAETENGAVCSRVFMLLITGEINGPYMSGDRESVCAWEGGIACAAWCVFVHRETSFTPRALHYLWCVYLRALRPQDTVSPLFGLMHSARICTFVSPWSISSCMHTLGLPATWRTCRGSSQGKLGQSSSRPGATAASVTHPAWWHFLCHVFKAPWTFSALCPSVILAVHADLLRRRS